MEDGIASNWQDRCERYFTSLTDSDKHRQKENKIKQQQQENCSFLDGVADADKKPKKLKVQYWFRALDIHGIHFAGSVRNSLECVVWVLITVIACGAFSFLLYLTINDYINQTSQYRFSPSPHKNRPKTFITVCNVNLLRKSSLLSHENRFLKLATVSSGSFHPQPAVKSAEQLIKNAGLWSPLSDLTQEGPATFVSELDQEFVPYSGMSFSEDWESLYGASMIYGFDIMKEAVKPTIAEMKIYGHQMSDMIVQCLMEESGICSLSYTKDTDPRRGNCATFNVSETIDTVSLLLNAEPAESLPVLTSTIGLSIQVYSADSSIENSRRHFVSPGNLLIIDNKKITSISRKTSCSESTGQPVQKCESNCIDIMTFKYCQCHTDGEQNNQCHVNDRFEFVCSKIVKKLFSANLLECKCLSKCSEVRYETEGTTMPWPSSQHLELLEALLQSKNFNKSTIKSALAYVTINLEPEIFEELSEDQSVTLLDLLSRIGGLSALVIGMSFVTVFQIIWMIVKICFHAAISIRSRSEKTVEKMADSEITSITWQAYKNKNPSETKQRFSFQHEPETCIQRNNSRRSYLEPIQEERKPDQVPQEIEDPVAEDQLFSHPWERTGHRRPYSTIINSNRSNGGEFPLFNYIDSRSNSPLPRCSTPDTSDYRSTAKLIPGDSDVRLYPPRNKLMTPADAIKSYGTTSPAKYQYSGPFYL